MEINKSINNQSALENYYHKALPDRKRHFLKQWIKFSGLKRNAFYARLQSPEQNDLMLWDYVNDQAVFTDRSLITQFVEANQPRLKEVEKYQISQDYINQIEEKFQL